MQHYFIKSCKRAWHSARLALPFLLFARLRDNIVIRTANYLKND